MYEFLIELGLKKYDIALLIFCPIGAVLGSFAHAIIQVINPDKLPRPGSVRILSNTDALGRAQWLMLRLTLGGILGLVVGLYFIGTLQESIIPLAKITALSILIGFSAPKIWFSQEKILIQQAINKLNTLMSSNLESNKNAGTSKSKDASA